MILSRRPKDNDNKNGFTNWPFMTTHTWGENPRGKWRLIARFQVNFKTLKFEHFHSKSLKLLLIAEIRLLSTINSLQVQLALNIQQHIFFLSFQMNFIIGFTGW